MKHTICYTCPALVVAGTLIASFALAEDKSASPKLDPKIEEMMKKAEAAGTPGAAHKALEPLVGNWIAEVKCWMVPDAPPTVTKGTAKSSWALNGRFVQEEFSGEFMGKPFRGMSLTGYDNTKQKYNSVWIDDMHTSMFTSEGEAESGKVITLEGKMDCPMTGQKDMAMKQVIRVISRDKPSSKCTTRAKAPTPRRWKLPTHGSKRYSANPKRSSRKVAALRSVPLELETASVRLKGLIRHNSLDSVLSLKPDYPGQKQFHLQGCRPVHGLAGAYHTTFAAKLEALDWLDWAAIRATQWEGMQHQKSAEFLTADYFPWAATQEIGCQNSMTADKVRSLLADAAHRPAVEIKTNWYY